ncbi:MAG TPA: DUF3298 domain-containing protein [Pyrinomonadaceae bacterium]|nr:DUF3298 domain-containing protein [Pyrinomonadaceae bacterium]
MKFLLATLLTVMLVALGGCKRASAPPPQNANSQTAEAEQLNPPAGGTTPVAEVKYFRGSIGSSLGLQMKLTREGDKLWGSYFYQKVGTKIDLKGSIDTNGYVTLEEFDPQGKQTGIFKGLWQQNQDDGLIAIAGNWTKPNGDKKTAFSLHQEPIEFSGGVEIASKSIKENNKKLKYEIDADYPQVTGATDGRYDKFNQEAKNVAAAEVANFRKEMAEWAAEQAEIQTDEEPASGNSGLQVGYTISLANDSLISTQFNIGTYFQGAAHPNSHTRVVNYDLKAGKPIKLADLFNPGSKYLQTISSYSIKELKKQSSKGGESMFDDEWVQKGAGPSADNYKSWVITKKGLGINFDAYQVAPYAAGPQHVLIPYSVLKDIIKPDGPLAPFLK